MKDSLFKFDGNIPNKTIYAFDMLLLPCCLHSYNLKSGQGRECRFTPQFVNLLSLINNRGSFKSIQLNGEHGVGERLTEGFAGGGKTVFP